MKMKYILCILVSATFGWFLSNTFAFTEWQFYAVVVPWGVLLGFYGGID